MKEEKLLKKIDKLLQMYGVDDEEQRKGFLNDIQDAKYDEEEIVEENNEGEQPEETPTEETPEDNLPTPTEETKEEEPVEESPEQEQPQEEVANDSEEPMEETLPEQPAEETPTEQPMEQPLAPKEDKVSVLEGKLEEALKTIESYDARMKVLEDTLSKLGVPSDSFGTSPSEHKEVDENTGMEEINRKRLGY